MQFSGELKHYKELDYEGTLYCEIISGMLVKRLYKKSNGIRVLVKTDGNSYVLGLLVKESMSLMNYIALIQDNTKE